MCEKYEHIIPGKQQKYKFGIKKEIAVKGETHFQPRICSKAMQREKIATTGTHKRTSII